MAIYHLHIQIFSRGKVHSAVEKAAYRAGEKLKSGYNGETYDHTRKAGVVHTEILLPANAPPEYADRAVLWNAVEKIEAARNSQLAREIELAFPKESSLEQQKSLVREYCNKYFVSQGMVADVCIHDRNVGNPHAHIMLTMRPFEPDGSWGAKSKKDYILDKNGERIKLKSGEYKSRKVGTVDWNEQTKAEEWRQGWSDIVNLFLEQNNITERIDHRSFKRQGIEQIPTVHMGVAASQMERKGTVTERGERNRRAKAANTEIQQLRSNLKQTKARLDKLNKWLDNTPQYEAPNLHTIINAMLGGSENKYQRQKVLDLKAAAAIKIFLDEKHITTMPQLREEVADMYRRRDGLSSEISGIDRREKVLTEHIRQAEIYQEYKGDYKAYLKQKPSRQEAYYESRREQLVPYEAAKKYLDAHLNGHSLPLKSWKDELSELHSKRAGLRLKYDSLIEEVRAVEIIRKNSEQLMRGAGQEREITRDKGAEL